MAEAVGSRYQLALTQLEMGRHLGSRDHLERATSVLDDLGATADRDRGRRLLADAR